MEMVRLSTTVINYLLSNISILLLFISSSMFSAGTHDLPLAMETLEGLKDIYRKYHQYDHVATAAAALASSEDVISVALPRYLCMRVLLLSLLSHYDCITGG